MTNRLSDLLLTALAPASWGTTYLVATEFLPPGRPLLAGTLRALPVGLLLLVLYRQWPRGEWWWRTLVLGALNIGLFFALLFVAAYRLPGGVAATLGAINPLLAAVLSWWFLGERLSAWKLAAGVAGVIGVALIVLGPAARLDTVGVLAGLGSVGAMAAGSLLTRRWGRPVALPVFTAWQLVAGGLMLLGLTWVVEGAVPMLTARQLGGAAYLGVVGTGLAYALWFRGLERVGTAASFLLLLSPAVAVVLGFAVLGQALTAVQVAGIALVLGSVCAGNLEGTLRAPRTPLAS